MRARSHNSTCRSVRSKADGSKIGASALILSMTFMSGLCEFALQRAVADHGEIVHLDRAAAQRQVEMAEREAVGELVGAGGIEEIAGKGAQLGAVGVAPAIHGERLVARQWIHP